MQYIKIRRKSLNNLKRFTFLLLMSIFISDHQKLLIRAQMFRNMQDTSILLIHIVQDSCSHSFICLIILFDINFEVCLVKMCRKSLMSGINASHFKAGHLAAPPPPSLVSKNISTSDIFWRQYDKGAKYTYKWNWN